MLASGVLVDLEKVEAEMSWRSRMSIFEICSFLRLAGHYERHENGLKLSIRDMIIGFHLLDTNSTVGTTLTIEREIEDT